MTTALDQTKSKSQGNDGSDNNKVYPVEEKTSAKPDSTPNLVKAKTTLEEAGVKFAEKKVEVGSGVSGSTGRSQDGTGGGAGAGFATEEPALKETMVARRAYNKDAPTQDDIDLVPMPKHIWETDQVDKAEYLSQLDPAFVEKYKLSNPEYSYAEVKNYVEAKQKTARKEKLNRALEQALIQKQVQKASEISDPTRKLDTNDVLEMYILNSAQQSASHAQSEQAQAANFDRLQKGLELLNKYKTEPFLYQEPSDVVRNQHLIFAATQMMAPLVGLAAGDPGSFMEAAATGGKQAADVIAKTDKERKERNVAYAQAYNKALGSSQKEVAGLIKQYMDTAEEIDKTRLMEISDIANNEEKMRHNQKEEFLNDQKLRLDEAFKNKSISRNEWETKTKLWQEENKQITEWNKNQTNIAKIKSSEARAAYKLKGKIHTDGLNRANKRYKETNRKTVDNVKHLFPTAGLWLDKATGLEVQDGRAYEMAVNKTSGQRRLLSDMFRVPDFEEANLSDPNNAKLARKTIDFLRMYSDMVGTNKQSIVPLAGKIHPGDIVFDMDRVIREVNGKQTVDAKTGKLIEFWAGLKGEEYPEEFVVPGSEEELSKEATRKKYYQFIFQGISGDDVAIEDLGDNDATVLQESIIRTASKLEERLNRIGLKSASINYSANRDFIVSEQNMLRALAAGYSADDAKEAARFIGVPDKDIISFVNQYREWLEKKRGTGDK